MTSMSGHQSARAKSVEYLTPPEILRALGTFDLDPCCPAHMPWHTAKFMLSCDGLTTAWRGRVWLNPPFGADAAVWLRKLVAHGNGIALIPARTETRMFYESVWGVADAVCFVKGRPHFHYADGARAPFNSGAPIALIAYGKRNAAALRASGLGYVVGVQ